MKWRTGCEGPDQHPQTRIRMGPNPAWTHSKAPGTWTGHGTLTRNLVKIAALTAACRGDRSSPLVRGR